MINFFILIFLQHIANKHREKQFKCTICGKLYAFDWQLSHHQRGCGQMWSCTTCDKTYSERLSLLVHCRRNGHKLSDEADFKERFKSRRKKKDNSESESSPPPPTVIFVPIFVAVPPAQVVRPILPKGSDSQSTISTQTLEPSQGCSNCTKKARTVKIKQSTQTQTNQEDKMKGKASTSVQCAPVRSIKAKKKKDDQLIKESIETQTHESSLPINWPNQSNTDQSSKISVGIDADPYPIPWDYTGIFSTTQQSETVSSEMSVQTEEVALANQYSTIETQTIADHELLSLFDTEGHNDLFLELNMNDIETQTNWNEMNVTGTQTMDASTCIDDFLKDFNL